MTETTLKRHILDALKRQEIEIPMPIPSLANRRGHWAKWAAVMKSQRATVATVLGAHLDRPRLPCLVLLVRISPRLLDDDNLAGALKAIRDGAADWIGADDKPGSGITWQYGQEKSLRPKYQAARIVTMEQGE
jgi:hypothetical protein